MFWRICILIRENAAPTSAQLLAARRATHLRHEGGRHAQNLAGFQSGVIELLALCYCLQLATRLWVQVPAAAKYFFISMFNLRIANGAKVGLKLKLGTVI